MQVTLPHKPSPGKQREYFELNTRYTIACIGRQFGKTTIALLRHVLKAIGKQGQYWWVAPTIAQARVPFKRTINDYKGLIKRVNLSFMEIEWINGSVTTFKGADNKENLRGETLHGLTVDEAASLDPELWPIILRPMLARYEGWADFIGTPKGKNWYYDLWIHALGSEDWSRIQACSKDSPYFSESEWDEVKRVTPEIIFRQEYEAQFVDVGGVVFRNIHECVYDTLSEPKGNVQYFGGVDLARTVDFTVITVLNANRELVYFDRFQDTAWSVQKRRILSVYEKYKCLFCIDSTGVGDPIFDDLALAGVRVQAYKFTNPSKRQLIENLILTFEELNIKLHNIEVLLYELSIFEIEQLVSGTIRYSAPAGKHDDTVISLALANWITPSFAGDIIDAGGDRVMTGSMYD